MPSYYNRIKGTLEVAKLAQSSDIHLIQSSIQDAISNVITDMFGPSFVLGEEENDLKLVPTAIHVDQTNTNYDEDNQWISFYERYFRQNILIEKSSIESIKVHMINDSNITTTVYAEIRDINFNLLKETNAKLYPTENDEYQEVEFVFNLHHLGVGRYYFIIKPIDISAADLALNGDESVYDTITPEMFCIRYDRNGEYYEGLEASYNGVDYLDAYLLEDQLEYDENDIAVMHETNFDLYFEQIFSSGNTYLITPGAAIVHGQKVYPIDTHVTISGASQAGDRTDLVVLTQEGFLNVIEGTVYEGEIQRPRSDTGLKIAYITNYKAQGETWVCSECRHINEANNQYCTECGTAINIKMPLVEQADENGMTRQRDVLERLRRLEKKMLYEQEYNRPTRIKYTCTNDPIAEENTENGVDKDGTYEMVTIEQNGETIVVPKSQISSSVFSWALKDKSEIVATVIKAKTQPAVLYSWDLYIPYNKPKTIDKNYYYKACVMDTKNKPISKVPIQIHLKYGKQSVYKTTITTNSKGYAYFNLYSLKFPKEGKYTMSATYGNKTVKVTVGLLKNVTANFVSTAYQKAFLLQERNDLASVKKYMKSENITDVTAYANSTALKFTTDNNTKDKNKNKKTKEVKYKITQKSVPINIVIEGAKVVESEKQVVKDSVIAGDDSFYKDNAVVDIKTGEARIDKLNISDEDVYDTNKPLAEENIEPEPVTYKINDNVKKLNSQYPVLNLKFKQGGFVHTITPYIKKFKNIEAFQIILFENDKVFAQEEGKRISYQKQIEYDPIFPNVYASPMIDIGPISRADKQGNRILNNYYQFTVDQDIPAGNYSLFVYGKLAEGHSEGVIFIDEYETMSEGDKYGTSTKCLGSCNPSIIYLETNNITSKSWDVVIERKTDVYKGTGIIISSPKKFDSNYNIQSCQIDKEVDIPNGCDLTIQVSNDGGRNWITAKNNFVTFSGLGNSFEWKAIFKSNGTGTPKIKFNPKKGYAISFTVTAMSNDYIPYEDYERCLETPVMDFTAMTNKVFGDSTVGYKNFSEWEFARLFMEDNARLNKIDILISNSNTDDAPIYTSTPRKDWNKNLFFNQAICGLTLDDFSHSSIDYSNYDGDLEPDEYNYRFKYQTELSYNRGDEVVGTPENAINFVNYIDINTDNFTNDSSHISDSHIYYGNDTQETQYDGTHIASGPYYSVQYNGTIEGESTTEVNTEEDTQEETTVTSPVANRQYYNSDEDPTYNRQTVIIGMLFEDGLTIDERYTDLSLYIYPEMADTQDRPQNNDGKYYFPGGTFEIVVALNPYGLIEDNATYGKAYTIKEDLICEEFNRITVPIYDDFYAYTDVYSIGIRVKDISSASIKASKLTNTEENDETETTTTNWTSTTLMSGDKIGLGDLVLGAHNIKLYYPANGRYQWKRRPCTKGDITKSFVSVQDYVSGAGVIRYPLVNVKESNSDSSGNNNNNIKYNNLEGDDTLELHEGTTRAAWKINVPSSIKESWFGHTSCSVSNETVQAHINNERLRVGNNKTYLQYPKMVFDFKQSETGALFYIDVDFTLNPYNLIKVEHYVEQGTFITGDIIIDFYDVRDHENSGVGPIESLVLPAWGQIQDRSTKEKKIVTAWFKKHNNGRVKRIVIRRENPGQNAISPLTLILGDISMHKTTSVPAVGPQMQLRIFPNAEANMSNTKIRKFGVVYRLA